MPQHTKTSRVLQAQPSAGALGGQLSVPAVLQPVTQGLRLLLFYGFSNLGLTLAFSLVDWSVAHVKVKLHKHFSLETVTTPPSLQGQREKGSW